MLGHRRKTLEMRLKVLKILKEVIDFNYYQ